MADENVFLLLSLLLGVFITFVYDLLRILRRVIPHNRFWVSLEDLLFWGFCAVEVFLLMYEVSDGTLRWFAVLGALTGMLLYRKTVSGVLVKYVSLLLSRIFELLGRFLKFLLRPFAALSARMGKAAGSVSGRGRKVSRTLKKKLTGFLKMLKMVVWKQ